MPWIPGNKFLAAETHILSGMLFVLGPIALHLWSNPLYGMLSILLIDLPKEFVFDRIVEGQEPIGGLVDFLWWLLGGFLALALVLLSSHLSAR
jgi:hypothetical protein